MIKILQKTQKPSMAIIMGRDERSNPLNIISPAKRKYFGFTLAEVLITLAIIGVVAAITIPNLMQAHTNHITEVRLKKFYSDMNNAIRLSELENGPHQYWSDYWELSNFENTENVCDPQKIENIVNKYFAPYMKISKIDVINGVSYFAFPDGSAFAYHNPYSVRDISFFPKNYKKIAMRNKRQWGKNAFVFEFLDSSDLEEQEKWKWKYVANKGFVPYLYQWDGTENGLTETNGYHPCANISNPQKGAYCTEVIRRNNWKIPKDYPFKIRY